VSEAPPARYQHREPPDQGPSSRRLTGGCCAHGVTLHPGYYLRRTSFRPGKTAGCQAAPPGRTRVPAACRCPVHWDSAIAKHNGTIRADMERQGKILAPLDLLNATHALSVGAVMMTNDQAFCHVVDLFIEDWTMHPMHGE